MAGGAAFVGAGGARCRTLDVLFLSPADSPFLFPGLRETVWKREMATVPPVVYLRGGAVDHAEIYERVL